MILNKIGSKQNHAILSILIVFSVMTISCASAPYAQKEGDVMKLVQLINDGKVGEKEGVTRTPFILDSETLYLESDTSRMWKNLEEATFRMSKANFISSEFTGENSYKLFADTYDMKNYFAKYTGKDTSVVTLATGEGRYYLLLDRKVKGYPRIQGLKGPVE